VEIGATSMKLRYTNYREELSSITLQKLSSELLSVHGFLDTKFSTFVGNVLSFVEFRDNQIVFHFLGGKSAVLELKEEQPSWVSPVYFATFNGHSFPLNLDSYKRIVERYLYIRKRD
jgi:hypothetical protein